MGRLIEIEPTQDLPPLLTLRVGDALRVWASGGRVESGADVVESLGPYQMSVLGTHGDVIAPAGPPNVILFVARRPGRATVEVMTGDPWHSSQSQSQQINVTQ
jgi:hypothetical protein